VSAYRDLGRPPKTLPKTPDLHIWIRPWDLYRMLTTQSRL